MSHLVLITKGKICLVSVCVSPSPGSKLLSRLGGISDPSKGKNNCSRHTLTNTHAQTHIPTHSCIHNIYTRVHVRMHTRPHTYTNTLSLVLFVSGPFHLWNHPRQTCFH